MRNFLVLVIMVNTDIIKQLCNIAISAGDAIATVHQMIIDLDVQTKSDGSEVTAADLLSHQITEAGILGLPMQAYPIISEESDLAEIANLSDFECAWLVDPLDGTKGFIAGHPNFTVNIALIKDGYPVLGIIEHPLTRECIWAAAGQGAHIFNSPLSESLRSSILSQGGSMKDCVPLVKQPYTPPSWRVLTGRYQNIPLWEERLASLGPLTMQAQNSSYKFCTLAKGEADIYPRGSQISAWDTAAGQCILEESGGAVIDFNGERLCYTGHAKSHKSQPRSGFIAFSDARQVAQCKELLINEGVIKNDKSR
jgi:3'(2'), 5'-bisphosphate nucleotidase